MKIFNSIKWRLQIWYGLILVVVLAGFGFTAYQLERGRQFRVIDDGLQTRFGVLANALHHPPPRESNANGQPFDRPPPDQLPDDGSPGQNSHLPIKLNLPPVGGGSFDKDDPHNFYFIIQSRDGNVIACSTNAPNPPPDTYSAGRSLHGATLVGIEQVNDSGGVLIRHLPSGELIQIGCSVAPELKELHLTALKLTGFGGIILFLDLRAAGGCFARAAAN